MKVEITLPSQVWGRLASLAEERNTDVGGLIADSIRATIDHPRGNTARIEQAVRNGWADGDIAVVLGMTRAAVAQLRRRAGLPANRPGNEQGEI